MVRVVYSLVSRAVLSQGEKYLLCRAKGYDFWFLPGGGVEDREDALLSLKRELQEETGLEIQKATYLTAVQNYFENRGAFENEVNLVFRGELAADAVVTSLEAHIEVGMFSKEEIGALKILPQSLKELLLDVADGKVIPPFIGYEA